MKAAEEKEDIDIDLIQQVFELSTQILYALCVENRIQQNGLNEIRRLIKSAFNGDLTFKGKSYGRPHPIGTAVFNKYISLKEKQSNDPTKRIFVLSIVNKLTEDEYELLCSLIRRSETKEEKKSKGRKRSPSSSAFSSSLSSFSSFSTFAFPDPLHLVPKEFSIPGSFLNTPLPLVY